ncbi:restriction endonuclease subunit S [Aeromonas veronii]
MVPKGWSQKLISDVGAVVTGNTPPTSNPEYYNGKYPFVSPADLGAHKLINSSIKSLSSQGMEKARSVRAGATLFTCIGSTIGKIGLAGCTLATNQQINVVIPKPDYDDDYVYYQLELRAAYIAKLAGTQAVPIINKTTFESQCILVPDSLPEQKKIAQILSTWDKAITTTEQLLANSQQQKKALMQQLLTGKKRLRDNKGVRFCGEWKQVKLSKIFERVTTKNDGKSTNVVTISGQQGLIRQEDFFKKSVASDILDGYFLLMKGQFAYNKSYSNGYPMGAIKRLNRYADGVVTTLYICFEISESTKANGDFWEHYFESGLLNKGLSQIAHEGGRAHGLLNVKPTDFFLLKVPLPSLDEQQKIAAVLSTSDQEITTLQQNLDALKLEKKALMQQLLTGKRRVKTEEVL